MTLLAIPNAINSAISSLSGHGHKKGVNGSQNSALTSTSGTNATQSGTTEGLFGTLMDSAEQLVGIQTPTSTTAATSPHSATSPTAVHGAAALSTAAQPSKFSAAAMITAARSALP